LFSIERLGVIPFFDIKDVKKMGYTALYRKFRPQVFSDIVGQEHITRTLKNQIIANRVGHAYLFNGGRGTGKTTAAKILSRAMNCLSPKDGEPCNECEICKEALAGSLTDIVEMDAASNNSVEDIRGIKEEVNFLPTKAKYRVYIIDEVHMLSVGAFNALLKTLEEPPEHVKFILATTEPQKLPATILSRCQRFDFKRISNENIIKRLQIVCTESNIEITEDAMKILAELAEGAMRDALSILERCVQDGENKIDENKIRDLVGIPKITTVHEISKAIIDYNVDQALIAINSVLEDGKDINNFLWEIVKYIKDILLIKSNVEIGLYNKEELENIKELANSITKERAVKLIYDLSELENNMKWSSQKLIMFQAGIIKLCNKQEEVVKEVSSGNGSGLELRIEKIENYLRSGNIIRQSVSKQVEKPKEEKVESKKNAVAKEEKASQSVASSEKIQEAWTKIVNDLKGKGKMTLYANLLNTQATEINDMTVGIKFPNGITSFVKTVLERPENSKVISDMVSIAIGKEMNIKYIDSGEQSTKTEGNVEKLENFANGFDIPFNIVD